MIRTNRVPGQPAPTEPNPCQANRAIRRSELTSGEALVMQVIADRARNPWSVCSDSYKALAGMTNLSRRTVTRYVRRLAEKQWIVVEPTWSEDGGNGPNAYRMGPRFQQAVEEQTQRERDEKGGR